MLPEQDAGQPVGRDEANEAAVLVDHRQSRLSPLRRQPCGPLLARTRGDHGRIAVHHVSQHGVRGGRQEPFDRAEAH